MINSPKLEIEIPSEHAGLTSFLLMKALSVVVDEYGKQSEADEWKQELYEKVQADFAELQALISMLDPAVVPTIAGHTSDFSAAMRTGMMAIDKAFDGIGLSSEA